MSQTGSGKDSHPVMRQMTLTADQKLRCNFCQQTIGGGRKDRAMQQTSVLHGRDSLGHCDSLQSSVGRSYTVTSDLPLESFAS